MQNKYKLAERAVLMRLSISLPGEARQDPGLSEDVKKEHGLGSGSGKWIKTLFPPEALQKIKKLDNEARAYHLAVTLPFEAGIGILPAPLIPDYGERMKQFSFRRQELVESEFLKDPQKWIDWAKANHNGTFDPDVYPGCELVDGAVVFNAEEFRSSMRDKFTFRNEPCPVPDAAHFQNTVASLLGTDTESVNMRVADSMQEAQKELMKRLIAPVRAMAEKLGSSEAIFRDTLVGNLKEIAALGPKLNLSGDAAIDGFCREIAVLGTADPEALRSDKGTRNEAHMRAADLLKRLSGYKI